MWCCADSETNWNKYESNIYFLVPFYRTLSHCFHLQQEVPVRFIQLAGTGPHQMPHNLCSNYCLPSTKAKPLMDMSEQPGMRASNSTWGISSRGWSDYYLKGLLHQALLLCAFHSQKRAPCISSSIPEFSWITSLIFGDQQLSWLAIFIICLSQLLWTYGIEANWGLE